MRFHFMWLWDMRQQARERDRRAEEDLAHSKQMLEDSRDATRPLKRAAEVNHFSAIIRDALQIPYHSR